MTQAQRDNLSDEDLVAIVKGTRSPIASEDQAWTLLLARFQQRSVAFLNKHVFDLRQSLRAMGHREQGRAGGKTAGPSGDHGAGGCADFCADVMGKALTGYLRGKVGKSGRVARFSTYYYRVLANEVNNAARIPIQTERELAATVKTQDTGDEDVPAAAIRIRRISPLEGLVLDEAATPARAFPRDGGRTPARTAGAASGRRGRGSRPSPVARPAGVRRAQVPGATGGPVPALARPRWRFRGDRVDGPPEGAPRT